MSDVMCGSSVCPYRYASLYFCCAIEEQDNELITLEVIHRFVELLDKYFGSVSPASLSLDFLLGSLCRFYHAARRMQGPVCWV